MRAVASVPPPAPQGQTIVTGRLGQAWARADPTPRVATAPAAPPATSRSRRVYVLITISSESFFYAANIPQPAQRTTPIVELRGTGIVNAAHEWTSPPNSARECAQ